MKPPANAIGNGVQRRRRWNVMLVDDHPVVRECLAHCIRLEPDLEVSASSESCAQALKALEEHHPDVMVVDLSLADGHGLDLIKEVHTLRPAVRLLVFSMHDENVYGERALRAGALGYVMKDESPETVLNAIRMVLDGAIAISPNLSDRMLRAAANAHTYGGKPAMERLTDRELEIFELIGRGFGTKEIAARLHRSVKTVETHRMRMKEKLDIRANAELIAKAACWVHETDGRSGVRSAGKSPRSSNREGRPKHGRSSCANA
jgi:DNA-binding NarL/FixJ family response regulator